jgi:hypothetical protein
MVAVNGQLEPEAGHTVLAALEPLARPADAGDARQGSQRTADALTELARRALEGAAYRRRVGSGPSCWSPWTWPASSAAPARWVGPGVGRPPGPQASRRLACDGAVTRVLVSRQPTSQQPTCDTDHGSAAAGHQSTAAPDPGGPGGLQGRLRAARALLPPALGGAPTQPLEIGRVTRVIHPAQRAALAVRDRGCVFPGCERPLSWCDAHHLWHWIDGGPTNLANLAMVCRAHHRQVHEQGWQLTRGPDGRFTATPTSRRHPAVA